MFHPVSTLTITCVAILGALVFALGANVTRLRAATDTERQLAADPTSPLFKAVRAHGNAAEYVPTLAVLMLLCSALGSGWWPAVLAVAAVLVRLLHAAGMLASRTLAVPNLLREIGAAGTYAVGMALALTTVVGR